MEMQTRGLTTIPVLAFGLSRKLPPARFHPGHIAVVSENSGRTTRRLPPLESVSSGFSATGAICAQLELAAGLYEVSAEGAFYPNNTMKTLLSPALAAFAMLALASPAICQEKPKATDTKETKAHAMVDHVMMKKGKMMIVKGGKSAPMETEMTLSDGSKVMTDGTMVHKDGTKMKLEDGQMLGMDGKMMMGDHLMMKDGKMCCMKDGKMTMMDKEMTMENGCKVMTDGSCLMKDGTKMMMKEGDKMSMQGKLTPFTPLKPNRP